ncbi:MAG: hypothetical protein F6K65_34960 [Moorea sp. SIO3C2]|nr:hypothetical protein [Moorena sp. SIO3C2]
MIAKGAGSRESEVRSQKSEVGSRESGVGSRESGVGGRFLHLGSKGECGILNSQFLILNS